MKIILTLPCFDYMTPLCHFEGKSGKLYSFIWSKTYGTHVYQHDPSRKGAEGFMLGERELNEVAEDIYFSPHLGPSFPIVPVAITAFEEGEDVTKGNDGQKGKARIRKRGCKRTV